MFLLLWVFVRWTANLGEALPFNPLILYHTHVVEVLFYIQLFGDSW